MDPREAMEDGAPGTRSVIMDSWRRSLAAHVDPDRHEAPVVFAPDEVASLRASHQLAATLPTLRSTLVSIADEASHIMIVTDADGLILWCEGAAPIRRNAERAHLTEGSRWSENAIGTNAMGTALATGRPVTVHSAEHLVRTYHSWTCAASPIRDPDTGRIIGAVDVSGPVTTVHPSTIALVSASAQLAEALMATQLAQRDERLRSANMHHLTALRGEPGALLSPTGRVLASTVDIGVRVDVAAPGGILEPLDSCYLLRLPARYAPVLSLRFLGGLSATVDGRPLALTLRHAEVLTALALHPAGLTAEQLALLLYGERGNPVTVRTELHRLRAQLGGVLLTKPYRLEADVRADFLTVRNALNAGDPLVAAFAYRGPLLPMSESPVVLAEREDLAAGVRRAVLSRGDPEALWSFAQTGDDAEVLERLTRTLPTTDPRHALTQTRLRRFHTA